MGNLKELFILFPIISIIVSLFLPLLALTFNLLDRARLSRIHNFEELKKMRIMILRDLSERKTFTIDDVIKEAENRKAIFDKARKLLSWGVYVLLFMFYLALAEYLIKYYRVTYLGDILSLKFPLADIVSFVIFNFWLGASMFNKLGERRADMFLRKLNDLKDKKGHR